ncbi:hypothetical protein ACJZ2D_004582 [Fusarium nematophilum]
MHTTLLLLASALWATCCNAATLFVADSRGNLTTLDLTGSKLSVTSKTPDCEVNPSWLTLDSPSRVMYCLDHGGSESTEGSLNSFLVGNGGKLTHLDRVEAPLSGVSAEIVTVKSVARLYVSASYNPGAAALYALSDMGALPGTNPLQQILPKISKTGPVASRQEASHLHHVIVDPKGQYVLIPDLGGDVIRVYSWQQDKLFEVNGLTADPGSGPRHGVFRVNSEGQTFFFVTGELNQMVYSYRVEYKESGLAFTKVSELAGISNEIPVDLAPTSEVALSPDQRFLVVSSHYGWASGSHSLTTFSISQNGTLKRVQLAPSGGYNPRQFSFNKAGDRITVGY